VGSAERYAVRTGQGTNWIPALHAGMLTKAGFLPYHDLLEETEFTANRSASGSGWQAIFYDSPRTLRPKLVLFTATDPAAPALTPCDPAAPAPTIGSVRVHPGDSATSWTVTWRTNTDANSLVLVDVPVPELQERLRQGKIYPPDQAKLALQNFFRTELLVRLRELALLQTADFSGHDLPIDPSSAAAESRIAVAVPFDPAIAKPLILRASRLAGRMNTKWFALYVRRERDHPERMSATEHRLLTENVQLAMSLGASVVFKESEDVVTTICDFLRSENIGLLVVGQPRRRGLSARLSPGIVNLILEKMLGFDILVVEVSHAE